MPNDDLDPVDNGDGNPPQGGNADQGGRADADPTGNRPFLSALHTALSGRGFSDAFVDDMQHATDDLQRLLANPGAIDPDDLPVSKLVEAAQMFLDVPDDLTVQLLSRKKKLWLQIKDAEALKQILGDQKKKAALAKMVSDLGESIRAGLGQAQADATNGVPFAETRAALLELAEILFDKRDFQPAFQLSEDAAAIKNLTERQASRANAPQGPTVGDRTTTDHIAAQDPLETLLRDLGRRRQDQTGDLERVDKVLTTYSPLPDNLVATHEIFVETVRLHGALVLPDNTALQDGSVDRDRLMVFSGRLDEIDAKLDALSRVGTEKAEAARKAAKKTLTKLVSFDGSTAERQGADVTGAGTALMRGKARDVPQSVVAPLIAKYDALRVMASAGTLTPEQIAIIELFQAEIDAEAQEITENLSAYETAADRLAKAHEIVSDAVFAYDEADRKLVESALLELEDAQNRMSAEMLADRATALVDRAKSARSRAETAKADFKAKRKTFESERKRIAGLHVTALKHLLDLAAADDDGAELKDRLKGIKNEMVTEGVYAQRFADMWKLVQQSAPGTYDDDSDFARHLAEDPDVFQAEIEALEAHIRSAEERMQAHASLGEDKTLRGWIAERADTNPVKAALGGALQEIADVHDAVTARDSAEGDFNSDLSELKAYISSHAEGVTHDARDGFRNYELLLDALKARSNTCQRFEDWQDLDKELREYDTAIKACYGDHRRLGDEVTDHDALIRTRDILAAVRRSIGDFKTDVQGLYTALTGPERTKAEAAQGDADAIGIVALLDNRDAELRQYIDGLKRAIDDNQSENLEAQLDQDGLNDDQRIALREQAIAIIRRRRMFLEQNSAALIYRNNPIDLGAPALALVSRLSEAESRILSFFKRG